MFLLLSYLAFEMQLERTVTLITKNTTPLETEQMCVIYIILHTRTVLANISFIILSMFYNTHMVSLSLPNPICMEHTKQISLFCDSQRLRTPRLALPSLLHYTLSAHPTTQYAMHANTQLVSHVKEKSTITLYLVDVRMLSAAIHTSCFVLSLYAYRMKTWCPGSGSEILYSV